MINTVYWTVLSYEGTLLGWAVGRVWDQIRDTSGIAFRTVPYLQYRYKTIGHLWQDRFKSNVIQRDQYLLNCITYIEYNPVRAKIVLRPEDYEWSSYRSRILGNDKYGLLDSIVL